MIAKTPSVKTKFDRLGHRPQNTKMPNIASILKEEILRVARKEIRNEIAILRKAVTTQRSDIAELKRRVLAAERQVSALTKMRSKLEARGAQPQAEVSSVKKTRFSAKGLASNRKRLGLSADKLGLLVGVGGQSIYNWEAGTARPRESFLTAIAELNKIGKKEATARLLAMSAQTAE
jgi:DNA-binding transcriptional regulator YiaG